MTPTLGASCLAPYPHMAKPMGGVTSTFETPAWRPASGPSAFAETDEQARMIKPSHKLRRCGNRLAMAEVPSGAVEIGKNVPKGMTTTQSRSKSIVLQLEGRPPVDRLLFDAEAQFRGLRLGVAALEAVGAYESVQRPAPLLPGDGDGVIAFRRPLPGDVGGQGEVTLRGHLSDHPRRRRVAPGRLAG